MLNETKKCFENFENFKNKEINIKNIINHKKNILLKVDIEGGEYEILNDIKFYSKRINCLIIEFHEIKKNLKKKKCNIFK